MGRGLESVGKTEGYFKVKVVRYGQGLRLGNTVSMTLIERRNGQTSNNPRTEHRRELCVILGLCIWIWFAL